ncbi:MAG: STAS domain-containing protein [Phycisphaerales bacterium]
MRFELDEPAPTPTRPGEQSFSPKTSTELLRVCEEDGVLRASLNDRSLRSLDTGKLRAEIAVLCRSHNSRLIVLSMRNTETLASSVLGALAQLSADLERAGGVLVLYKVPKEVSRVLRKTRLDRLIHTAKDRDAAKRKVKGIAQKSGFQRRTHAA